MEVLDAIIIGGGPAGLSAALVLGGFCSRPDSSMNCRRSKTSGSFTAAPVHSCPYCDGWECRGQPIAVIGGNQESLDLAIELLLWSKDLVLCTNGALMVDRRAVEIIKRLGIRIIETPIALLEGVGNTLEGIRFTDGSYLPRSALFFSPGQYQRSPLAEQLGCEFCEDDNCIQCGEDAATNIPGVYAAGNASRGVQLVIAAAAEGMQAALQSIARSSTQMLRVMRCAITSPADPCLRVVLRQARRPSTSAVAIVRMRLCNLVASSRPRVPRSRRIHRSAVLSGPQVSTAVYDKRTQITVYVFSDE